MTKQLSLDLGKKKTRFTLEDVEIKTDIPLNLTFIDVNENLEEAVTWLKFKKDDICIDIETTGLDPHNADIIMLQFGDQYRQFVIDVRSVDVTSILPYIFNNENTLVGHNIKFEYKFIKKHWGIELQDVKDTMLQEKCIYNGYGLKNDLKSVAYRYLKYQADKTIRMRFLEIGDDPFSKDEIVYGAYDVILPMLILEQQEKKIKQRKMQKLVDLENNYAKVLGDMELKGLYFDADKWTDLYNENLEVYNKKCESLDDYVVNGNYYRFLNKQTDLFNIGKRSTISWSSSKQVIGFFEYLGICPEAVSKQTNKMRPTVDSKVLKASLQTTNKDIDPKLKQLIKDYLSMKEYGQRVTTFGVAFFKYINPETGRLHSNFNQIINTGRSSSSAPNLQNIPGDARYRQCFVAPKGHKIINADFSGQENIVLANKSLDKDLLEFYEGGNSDMHSFIASKIYNIDYEKFISAVGNKDSGKTLTDEELDLLTKRGIAKAAGFAINYGGTGYTIAKNLGISEKEGDEVYNAYFKAFPGLRKYFDEVIAETLELGYVPINKVTNRRFNISEFSKLKTYKDDPKKQKEYNKLKGKIGRTALNYPVQGTAGDITKYAAVVFRKWIIKNNLSDQVFITNIIHDEINVEAPFKISKRVAHNLEKSMEKAGKLWCKVVPLHATAQIKDYWTH